MRSNSPRPPSSAGAVPRPPSRGRFWSFSCWSSPSAATGHKKAELLFDSLVVFRVIDEETEKQFIHERRKAPGIGGKDYLARQSGTLVRLQGDIAVFSWPVSVPGKARLAGNGRSPCQKEHWALNWADERASRPATRGRRRRETAGAVWPIRRGGCGAGPGRPH